MRWPTAATEESAPAFLSQSRMASIAAAGSTLASDPSKLSSAVSPAAVLTEPFAVAPMPSIWPEARRLGSPPLARRKAANLSDDEPALRVRITESKMRHSAALAIVGRPAFPAPVFAQARQRARDEPNSMIIGPARRHD